MHSVELMEEAITLAEQLGWRIRHEYLGEVGGGACEIGGRKWIFVDLALTPLEQFDQVIAAVKADTAVYTVKVPECLTEHLDIRRAA